MLITAISPALAAAFVAPCSVRSGPADEATRAYSALAKKYGLTLPELALRWCRERQALTSVLLGVSNSDQLKQNLAYFQNPEPLDEQLLWEIDRIHMRNRLPIFSSDRVGEDWGGAGEIGEPIP